MHLDWHGRSRPIDPVECSTNLLTQPADCVICLRTRGTFEEREELSYMSQHDWSGRRLAMWQNRLYSRRLSEKNRAKAGGWLAALLALVFAFRAGAPALAYKPPAPPTPNPIADTPAATLLLPYFQVDLNNPNGVTTLFSIANASPDPQLAHVVIWSDLSVHVIDF